MLINFLIVITNNLCQSDRSPVVTQWIFKTSVLDHNPNGKTTVPAAPICESLVQPTSNKGPWSSVQAP